MNVRLVSLTKSFIKERELSPEELIVYIARVSNPSNQLNSETSDKLIAYLIKNKHWSPFEMVDMTVEIKTSRGIAQQILRHRSFSFQEFSQRYAEVSNIENVEVRKSGATNRQSSSEKFNPDIKVEVYGGDGYVTVGADKAIDSLFQHSKAVYTGLIEAGVAKECARFVLPIATESTIYMKGSIRSWIHYLQIRTEEHTQLEHRNVANEILEIFKINFTNIAKAIEL